MDLTISALLTVVGNTIAFCTVPFLWWLVRHRKECGFFGWIGIRKPELKAKWWVLILVALIYCFVYTFVYFTLLSEETIANIEEVAGSSATSVYAGIGFAAVLPALIENFLANGVCEEVLFRGFLCKRLIGKLGMTGGIILQAVLFGLMHNLIYMLGGLPLGLAGHAVMFVFTATGAVLLGVLNEKICNGSILPSILLHGFGNFIATMMTAFPVK